MANFASLEQVRPFILAGLYNKLNSTVPGGSTKYFDAVASSVDTFITDRTGRPVSSGLPWMIFPYALLVSYFSSSLIENVTPERTDEISKGYTRALEILDAHPYTATGETGDSSLPDNSVGFSGSIDDVTEY